MILPPAETEQPDDRDPRGVLAVVASIIVTIALCVGTAAKWGWL